jgi:hypothetical protein
MLTFDFDTTFNTKSVDFEGGRLQDSIRLIIYSFSSKWEKLRVSLCVIQRGKLVNSFI